MVRPESAVLGACAATAAQPTRAEHPCGVAAPEAKAEARHGAQ